MVLGYTPHTPSHHKLFHQTQTGSPNSSLSHLAAPQPDSISGSYVPPGNIWLSRGKRHRSTGEFPHQSLLSLPAQLSAIHLPVPLLPAGIGSLGSVWE